MIKREILNKIRPWLKKEKILILKGARQVGKTYLLNILKKELEDKGARVAYLLADDIDNQPILRSAASLELYLEQYYNFPNDFIYLIIDEFQVINEAGVFLKNIFDKHKGKLQLIVSGSSSLAINKNSEYLTGRAIHFDINRISFKEYFNYQEKTAINHYSLAEFNKLETFFDTFKQKLELTLRDYLSYGAYPEVLSVKDIQEKEETLKSIIKTYIEKDIINQLKIENVNGFNNLIKLLSDQIGQLVNKNELANTARLSINTLNKYLDILVGTYIVDLVTPYCRNVRSEISKMPKVYLLDIGIRNYLLRSFAPGPRAQGNIIENFVYNTLLTQYSKEYVHFYRTNVGTEIDFVIEDKRDTLTLYEVKYRNKIKTPLIIKNFEQRYNNVGKKIIITKNLLNKKEGVYFIPATLLSFIDLS